MHTILVWVLACQAQVSLRGFLLELPTVERRYRRLGPATLHGPVLMSEHLKETGCAKLQYKGAGACWPKTGDQRKQAMTNCRGGG